MSNGEASLYSAASSLATYAAENVGLTKKDIMLDVMTPASVVKSIGTVGGCTVGYCGGAALGTGIGFALGGPVGAAIGYGIGILSGAGTGAIIGYQGAKAVTHILELPEDSTGTAAKSDNNPNVIEASHYSVSD